MEKLYNRFKSNNIKQKNIGMTGFEPLYKIYSKIN